MDRQQQPQVIADRYTNARQYSSIEWHFEQRGAVLSAGRSGMADATQAQPLPDSPIYRIYSMTKPIVSVLAMMLIEQGRLRLFDLLPAFDQRFANPTVLGADGSIAPAQRAVTVEDLITHRAGFTYEFIPGCHIAPYYQQAGIISQGERDLDDMMGALAQQPLAHQPGSTFRYSVATDVLAHVIERATDQRLDELLQEHIFAPLGMTETRFAVPEALHQRVLPMFGLGDITGLANLTPRPQTLEYLDPSDSYPLNNSDFRRGGHGLYSTLADYCRFARMLLSGQTEDGRTILSRKMLALMRTNRIPAAQLPLTIGPNAFGGYGWGLGVRVMIDLGQSNTLTGLGELGWAGAAGTYFWVDPAEQFTGVVMTQYLGGMMPMNDDMRVAGYQMLD